MQQGDSQTGASVSEVRDEIQTISQSRLFAQSRRRIKLLEYLCDMVLLGRQDEIKETTIALEVFERTTEFDDKKDAIVRVEAHRLRERLAKYYATEGSHDPLIIELAPGGYIPRFIAREPEPAEPAAERAVGRPAARAAAVSSVIGKCWPWRRHWWSSHSVLPWRLTAEALFRVRPSPLPVSVAPPASPTAGIRILAGSTKPYMDRAGRLWRADSYFTGGVAQPGPD